MKGRRNAAQTMKVGPFSHRECKTQLRRSSCLHSAAHYAYALGKASFTGT